jgi:hypothetical protein
MSAKGNDFQNTNYVYIVTDKALLPVPRGALVTDKNIIEVSIYFSVRHSIEPTWINDRDQFLYPNDGWKSDAEFQHDCLVFTLFHRQNRISARHGANHWIPFTEKEADAKEKFESNFMSGFLKNKTLSPQAVGVLDAGRELWKYYHAKIKNSGTASVNASFYDIREFFQGRKENGTMNAKSADETYNVLLAALREKQRSLTEKIKPKVYEYGFLKE